MRRRRNAAKRAARYRARLLKPDVIDRDRRCQYCGAAGVPLTVDHVRPLSLGGESDMGNLVACCEACNYYKADLLPLEYFWVWRPATMPGRARPA